MHCAINYSYTVYTGYIASPAHTFNTVYTIQTALHCSNSSMYAYAYIVREGKNAIGMG